MNDTFIRKRISELRIKKGVSEYRMSTDMGHSKSYIQSITSGRALPSLSEFLYMCQYFEITPKEFFDTGIKEPLLVSKITELIQTMKEEDLTILLSIIQRLLREE